MSAKINHANSGHETVPSPETSTTEYTVSRAQAHARAKASEDVNRDEARDVVCRDTHLDAVGPDQPW